MAKNKAEAPAEEAAKPAVEKAPKDSKNGVTRPGEGTTCRRVWDIASKLSNEKKEWATRKEVIEACVNAGINKATAMTQYGKWCVYLGKPKAAPVAKEAQAE